jgi:hypothetical protein
LVDVSIQGCIGKTSAKIQQRCYCNEGCLPFFIHYCYYFLTEQSF